MVAASGNNSPRNPGGCDRAGSHWAQVVRGADSESVAAAHPLMAAAPTSASSSDYFENQAEGYDDANSGNNAAKKPAWNKPSNGGVDVGSVMGGEVWPALSASASARASPKSSSSDSLKALSDGSPSESQGTGIQSSQEQLITNNTNSSFTPHHGTYTRQKSIKRGGGSSSGAANGGFAQPVSPSSGSVGQVTNNFGRPGSALPDSSPRDHAHREIGQRGGFGSQSHNGHGHGHDHAHREIGQRGGFGSQSHNGHDHAHREIRQRGGFGSQFHNGHGHGHDHSQQRTFRRGNGSPHPRGDGSSHPNYRARSEQDRGNHDWNSPRSFSNREAHMQPGVARGVIRPLPHGLSPYMPHPMPIPPLGNPMVYPEVPPPMMYAPVPEALRSVPILSPLSPRLMFLPPQLLANIMAQIQYYFSDSNLCKDIYLRKNMDEEGWVPVELIAGFKKVRELTDNVQIILDVLSSSTEVEVQGDKLRKRNDWKKWIMPTSVQFPTLSSPRSMGNPIHDPPIPNIKGLSLEERTGMPEAFLGRSSSGDLSTSSQRTNGEGTSQDNAKRSS